jgi:hypothetical protein
MLLVVPVAVDDTGDIPLLLTYTPPNDFFTGVDIQVFSIVVGDTTESPEATVTVTARLPVAEPESTVTQKAPWSVLINGQRYD